MAHRLSSPAGEEGFPRFSPDGRQIAFTGNYDGNRDLYVLPVDGGEVRRLTHHQVRDRMLDWFPDGSALLTASPMQSGRQRYSQFYRVSASGGLPERLSVPYGAFAALSPDGGSVAYVPRSRAFRTWKRYRGGAASDIWLFDLETFESRNITDNAANDDHPMWHGETVYFLSDQGPEARYNLWAFELADGTTRQVTHFEEFDVHFPSIGPADIVFEAGGRLHLLDLASQTHRPVEIQVVTDKAHTRPRYEHPGPVRNASVSPAGKRVALEARGEIFSLPAEHGPVVNLTRTPGIAERYPAWSPDGRTLAYWTDRKGEFQLAYRAADGTGDETLVGRPTAGYGYRPIWSPDSEKVAYVDHALRLHVHVRGG